MQDGRTTGHVGDEVAAPEVPPLGGTEDQALEPPGGFEHFYLREYRGVVELAYALSGNRAGAEDIAQEAFLRAHRDWQRVGHYQHPGAWVRRVAPDVINHRVMLAPEAMLENPHPAAHMIEIIGGVAVPR